MTATTDTAPETEDGPEPIAIIGMAVRLPGATDLDTLWRNMRDGTVSISTLTEEELLGSGVPARTLADPDYQRRGGILADADCFDAAFFGFSPREAETMDPQHRVFLECAWEAVENAGHDPQALGGAVGVFAGSFASKYWTSNLLANPAFRRSGSAATARILNDKDFLAVRAAFLFNLRGPALTVQTACSTSLVATHLACQSLWSYESDIALAGGVTVNLPLLSGYPAVEGGLFSTDGHCRPFDARARGTVPGNGAAVLVLRRLSEAVEDGDPVWAVIRGSAVNNDGAVKVGFTAPGMQGQAAVIAAAQDLAGVEPAAVGYVEAHGTATQVGDPIEVAGLTQAFTRGARPAGARSCALGSIKANIGHLDAAAGAAGLIRAVLALHHAQIPPSAGFTSANPLLELDRGPFYVPTQAAQWSTADGRPRLAGVSSFGVGGTNAHVVVGQAPDRTRAVPVPSRPYQLLTLSARTPQALRRQAERLGAHLAGHPELGLADVAYTLQEGRQEFGVRRALVCRDREDAVARLAAAASDPGEAAAAGGVVFMFPGSGAQFPHMGAELYRHEPSFRRDIGQCADVLRPLLGWDLRDQFSDAPGAPVLDPGDIPGFMAAIVALDYAQARLWQSWGVLPTAMLGHSLGEYAAACLSGVFEIQDAMELVVARGRLIQRARGGRMLAVPLGERDVTRELRGSLSLAAVNAPGLTTVTGLVEEIEDLERRLLARGLDCRRVPVEMAAHSVLLDPYLDEFAELVGTYKLRAPRIPFVSSVSGTWITEREATDPRYWARHMREPVRFADGLATVGTDDVLLEVGPGRTLTALTRAQPASARSRATASMPDKAGQGRDLGDMLDALGRLWAAGVRFDRAAVRGEGSHLRVPLPGYPFERTRHWISAPVEATSPDDVAPPAWARESRPADTLVQDAAQHSAAGSPSDTPDGAAEEAPASGTERWLIGIWRDLLGAETIGPADDFFDLGGHSLMATTMFARIRADSGVSLTTRDLLDGSSLADLVRIVEVRAGAPVGLIGAAGPLQAGRSVQAGPVSGEVRRDGGSPALDLAAEVALDPAIRPGRRALAAPSAAPKHVLLTGATGFVGAFLCAELLSRTEAQIHCLVRAPSPAEGLDRIKQRLAAIGVAGDVLGRVTAVPGDLCEPLLGLDAADFAELAGRIEAIYHCGAYVNFARPYRGLKAANVGGVQEVLRLACAGGLIPVHHVSTMAALAGAMDGSVPEIFEDWELPRPVGHDTGYSQSKWVAEGVVGLARLRGVPVSVYRPGMVLGHSVTGETNAEDYLTKMIQACAEIGAAPLRRYPMAAASVDYVGAAIVALSLRPELLGGTFHLVNPEPLEWNTLFDGIRAAGHDIAAVEYADWRRRLADRAQAAPDGAAGAVDSLIGDVADRPMPRISVTNALAGLAGADVRPPALDAPYFATLLRHFSTRGWIPPRTGRSAPDGRGRPTSH